MVELKPNTVLSYPPIEQTAHISKKSLNSSIKNVSIFKVYESRYIALFVVSGFIEKLLRAFLN